MILKVILTLCATLTSISLFAQNSGSIGINAAAGTATFPLHGRFGIGLSAEYLRALSDRSSLRAYMGYEKFKQNFPHVNAMTLADSMKIIGLRGYDLALLPLRLGYQYNFINQRLFLFGEAGLSQVFTKYNNPTLPGTVFTYAAGIGYKQNITRGAYLQIGLSYNHYDLRVFGKRNYFDFRLAYGLTQRKK